VSVSSLHLMVIGAHAADAEAMAGGGVLLHTRQGHQATLLHLTLGGKGHPTLDEETYSRQKEAEARACAAALGADVRFLPYGDGELYPTEEVKFAVADVIRAVRPDVVITHWRESMHKDHANTHLIVQDAVFYAAIRGFARADPPHSVRRLYYAENWEDPFGFQPEVYLDISPVFADWLQALRSYELFRGGISRFPYLDYYQALAVVRGAEAGFPQAEAFAIPPLARRQRLKSFVL